MSEDLRHPSRRAYSSNERQKYLDDLKAWNARNNPRQAPKGQYRSVSDALKDYDIKPSPLRLTPQKAPPLPKTFNHGGFSYPIQAPAPNPDFAFVGNRDTLNGSWKKIGSPIQRGDRSIGQTTYNNLISRGDAVYGSEHHNFNLGAESTKSTQGLKDSLDTFGLPSDGDREELFKRNIRAKTHPTFQQGFANGTPPSDVEMRDIMGQGGPMTPAQAAQARAERAGRINQVPQPINPQPIAEAEGAVPMAEAVEGEAAIGAGAAGGGLGAAAGEAMPFFFLAQAAGQSLKKDKTKEKKRQEMNRLDAMRA